MSAFLKSHPKGSFKWIYAAFDFMLSPLVRTADREGRTELRGVSFDGNLENLAFIANGTIQSASIGYPLEWAGWGVVDDLNRYFHHKKLIDGKKYIKFRLLTKSNLPPAGKSYTGDLNFKSKFKKLWGR
jgi:ABC-type sugar transport system substrate-binding protein